MATLEEFLDEKAQGLLAEVSKAQAMRTEWATAVSRLHERIRSWITEADTAHVLQMAFNSVEVHEEVIGDYSIGALDINLGLRRVRVEPIARFALGPLASTGVMHFDRTFGRVDLTNGLEKRMLFRIAREPDGPRIIVREGRRGIEEFNRGAFEAAFQGLLES